MLKSGLECKSSFEFELTSPCLGKWRSCISCILGFTTEILVANTAIYRWFFLFLTK